MTSLAQVIIANCERWAFSGSVTVRATWAATFFSVHKRLVPTGRHSMSMLTLVDHDGDYIALSILPKSLSDMINQSRLRAKHFGDENSALWVREPKHANVR